MISYEVYKIIHLISIFMIFISLSGALFAYRVDPIKAEQFRKKLGMLHGIGLTGAIVAGFGLAARLDLMKNMPIWIYLKILIWLFFGASLTVARKRHALGGKILAVWIIVGGIAAVLAILKPL